MMLRGKVQWGSGRMPVRQGGLSLLEILVTLVILSVGLLGYAGLQLNGLKRNATAYERGQAMALAYDMADRVRANRDAALNGSYDWSDPFATKPTQNCESSSCANGTQMASSDLREWLQSASDLLPSGTGMVDHDAGAGTVTVTVMWDEARNAATGTGCDPTSTSDMRCFTVQFKP